MAYPRTWTVWFVKRTNRQCIRCGKRFGKRLVVVDPATFGQFWSLKEVLRETKAGWGDYCWRCATS